MELKFCIKNKEGRSENIICDYHEKICTVSYKNLVAYTKIILKPTSSKKSIPVYSVFIADINSIFEPHLLTQSLERISDIKFDFSGNYLLIVINWKDIKVFSKNSNLNSWNRTFSSNWKQEQLLHVNFFYPRNKPYIHPSESVLVSSHYAEKFQAIDHEPTLQSFPECTKEGLFVVTASGVLIAVTLTAGALEEEEKITLGPVRDHYFQATAAFAPNGRLNISAWKADTIKNWEVELSYEDADFYAESELRSEPEAKSSQLNFCSGRKLKASVVSTSLFKPLPLNNESKNASIEVLRMLYMDIDDPSSLLVIIQTDEKCEQNKTGKVRQILQRYKLQMKTRPLFQFNSSVTCKTPSGWLATVREWTCICEWTLPSLFSSCCDYIGTFCAYSTRYLPVSTVDGAIYLINKETLNQMSKYDLDLIKTEAPSNTKNSLVSMATTWSNLHLVCMDRNSNIYVVSMVKQSDIGCSWLVFMVLLLEFCLLNNYDWCDVLMCIPTSSAHTIADRIWENFNQSPQHLTTNLVTKFLVLKNSVMRLSSNLHQKSIETRLQAHLSAILKVFHTLRPVTFDFANDEKNLCANIQAYVESRNSLENGDIDRAIDTMLCTCRCNILDVQIDPTFAQDVQMLVQFSADLALYSLLMLVQNSKYELIKDAKTLHYIREILILSRLWFKHCKLVQPQMIRKSDSIDSCAQIYKLYTKLAQTIPNEPDPAFIDECVSLETQMLCREVPLFVSPRGIVGCIAAASPTAPSYPLQFEFGQKDPNANSSTINPRPLEGSLPCVQPLDILAHQFLGSSGPLFQCTRCFSIRGSWWGSNESSLWEQQWAKQCICSGFWAPMSSCNTSKAV